MTNIDQFESAFRAAVKETFSLEELRLRRVLVVTDTDDASSEAFAEQVRRFLANVPIVRDADWQVCSAQHLTSVSDVMARLKTSLPDMICTYRNLQVPATEHPYSLGTYVDVLTQDTDIPVLLLPREELQRDGVAQMKNTDAVMAITDHLTGDHHLVSFAARLVEADGTLYLTHVEDEITFSRYMATIGKIPSIDTETAHESLREQLLKEPRDYIRSCREVLQAAGAGVHVEEIVTFGHRLAEYRHLIEEHHIDLLVMNTKDADQLAMHGVAYPLTVELRGTPLMLL